MTGPLDRATLEQVVRTLARYHLEVERGLRSKDSFARQMPPSARLPYLQGNTPQSRIPGGPVSDADIRAVRVEAHNSGRIYATAITSTRQGHSGALSFVLETRNDRIALLQVVRLQTRGDYTRNHASPPTAAHTGSEHQRDIIRDSRDRAKAARRDLERKLETAATNDPQRPHLQRDHDTWTKLHDYYSDQYRQFDQQGRQRSPNPIRDRRRH